MCCMEFARPRICVQVFETILILLTYCCKIVMSIQGFCENGMIYTNCYCKNQFDSCQILALDCVFTRLYCFSSLLALRCYVAAVLAA